MRYIIDRFEGDFAVCETEDRQQLSVLKEELPPQVKEGSVLRVEDGVYRLDLCWEEEHREKIREKMDRLFE